MNCVISKFQIIILELNDYLYRIISEFYKRKTVKRRENLRIMLTDDEMPKMADRIRQKKGKDTYVPGPAFHEKKEKNKKVNLGGPAQKEKLKGKDAKIRTYRRN